MTSASRFLEIIDDPKYRTIVALQDLVTYESACYWRKRDVKAIHLPITTTSISSPMGLGSDSSPVKVMLHGQETYLADSMQFMLEYGCRFNQSGTWYIMPSFRGEPNDETHLGQFYHSEVELPGDLENLITNAESYLRALAESVTILQANSTSLDGYDLRHVASFARSTEFPRVTFEEAWAHLRGDTRSVRVVDDVRSITRFGEARLMSEIAPVLWVTNYDANAVPFYQAYADDERKHVKNADLLFGLGEILGAGERHQRGVDVRESLAQHEVDVSAYQWYVDLKEHYPMLTSGFGLGVERWMMWVLGVEDIRQVTLLERNNGVATTP